MTDNTTQNGSDSTPSREEQLDALFAAHRRSDAPGLVVGVALQGETIYRKAFGMASVQHGVANTTATRMRIGSTTKHMTCVAALLLAEEGLLDLDAPASEYLPEIAGQAPVPTLRQFMQHTSGYRCSLDAATALNGDARQPDGWTLQAYAGQVDRNFAPGEGQMYCNGGYHLLSIAIDRVAGMPLEDFMRQRMFEPLGMYDTEGLPSDHDYVPGLAALHLPRPDGGWKRGFFMTDEIRGEGNVISTIDDMLTWLAHLNQPDVFGSADSWAQFFDCPTLANGLRSVYSLGIHRNLYRGLEVVHHGGSVIGGNSQMLTVPAHGLDIAVMNNGAPVSTQDLTKAIIDIVLAEVIDAPKPEVAALEKFPQLDGAYYHGRESGVLVGFGALGDRIGFSFQGSPLLPILRAEQGGLFAGFEDVALGPLLFSELGDAADKAPPERIRFSESGNAEWMERLPEEGPPISSVAEALIGDYRSRDFGAQASIRLEGEDLILSARGDYGRTRRYRVEPKSDIALLLHSLDDVGAASGMTIRERGERVTGFDIDVIRARHLRFERQ